MTATPEFRVFLCGTPNSGKTSLFNLLTGERREIANWPGVTTHRAENFIFVDQQKLTFIDLPGMEDPPEELLREIHVGLAPESTWRPIVVAVIDTTNLKNDVHLPLEFMEKGIMPVLAYSFMDEMERRNISLDFSNISQAMGVPCFPVSARTGKGTMKLLGALAQMKFDKADLDATREFLRIHFEKSGDGPESPTPHVVEVFRARDQDLQNRLSVVLPREVQHFAQERTRLDAVLARSLIGLPIFFLLMGFVFGTTFFIGDIPGNLLKQGLIALKAWLNTLFPGSLLMDLLVNGILSGVGGVLVYLPNIIILFFWISVMEETGYLARAARIMEGFMRFFGLEGRSFLPLIMGFGCNVPAILASKIVPSPNKRYQLMLLIPLLGCSARLPVLVLFSGAFFPEHPGLWLLGIYLLNVAVILSLALVSKNWFRTRQESPSPSELPMYRIPDWKRVAATIVDKVEHFVRKAGTVILLGTIIIWALQSFPREAPPSRNFDLEIARLEMFYPGDQTHPGIRLLKTQREQEKLQGRYMTQLGNLIHPLVAPLGFGWREAVSLIPGFLAKESIVSTLAVLYGPVSTDLGKALKQEGTTPLSALCFMIFALMYVPCLPTLGVIYRESGSRKLTALALLIPGLIAWTTAFTTFKLGTLFGFLTR